MSKPASSHPITPAIRVLRRHAVSFEPLLYAYEEHGGTARSSELLGWQEHAVIKTLILRVSDGRRIAALMHGDRQASLRTLARALTAKTVNLCEPDEVRRLTGYQVGGVSPFGTRRPLGVVAQSSIASLPRLAINGGKRGFLVALAPQDLEQVLAPTWLDFATSPCSS